MDPTRKAKVTGKPAKRPPRVPSTRHRFCITQKQMGKTTAEFWAIPKWIFAKKELSLEARILYGILFTRANGENVAWPGQESLADTLGVSKRSIIRYVQELEKHDLIEAKRTGLNRTNRYIIKCQVGTSRSDTGGTSRSDTAVSSPIVKEQIEKKSSKELAAHSAAGEVPLNEIIEKFKIVNPSFERIYGNKTQRSALERLVKKYGVAKIEGAIKAASLVAGKKYAPSITTPLELEDKLGKLVQYYKREKSTGSMLVEI